jgi:hypothetical protein
MEGKKDVDSLQKSKINIRVRERQDARSKGKTREVPLNDKKF